MKRLVPKRDLVLNIWHNMTKMKDAPLWYRRRWEGDLLPQETIVELGIRSRAWPESIIRGTVWGHHAFPKFGPSQTDTVHIYVGLNRGLMNTLVDDREALAMFCRRLEEAGWKKRDVPLLFTVH